MTRFIGTDPEFAVYERRIEDEDYPVIVPPAALVEDHNIEIVEESPDVSGRIKKTLFVDKYGSKWVEDGAAIELNIDPVQNYYKLYSKVSRAHFSLGSFLRSKINDNFRVSKKDVVGFFDTEEYYENRGNNFRECVIFGCDPDIHPDIYDILELRKEDSNEGELDVSTHDRRYFGGHVHVQNMTDNPWLYEEIQDVAPIVFDFIVGTANVLLPRNKETLKKERERLQYYGLPGSIRLQTYDVENEITGIEYRPLSNRWLQGVQEINAIFSATNLAAEICEKEQAYNFVETFEILIPDLFEALVTFNEKLCNDILDKVLAWYVERDVITIKNIGGILELIGSIKQK